MPFLLLVNIDYVESSYHTAISVVHNRKSIFHPYQQLKYDIINVEAEAKHSVRILLSRPTYVCAEKGLERLPHQ